MKLPRLIPGRRLATACLASLCALAAPLRGEKQEEPTLRVSEQGCLEGRGLSVLVFNNAYDGLFSDAKMSGVEMIHHEVRTATNGDVRLSPTPAQWDPTPELIERKVLEKEGAVMARLAYKSLDFEYTVRTESRGKAFVISVWLEKPIPAALEGRAGLNLEFLPSAYFRRGYLSDGAAGGFPLHPGSEMSPGAGGEPEPLPLARGRHLVLAPEDETRRVSIESSDAELGLYDGRNTAQNGWFVVRSLLPAGRSGKVAEWTISPAMKADWLRAPVIGHSQVGYHPAAPKVAVIELDRRQEGEPKARLLRIDEQGKELEVLAARPEACAPYLRYNYKRFDFSGVHEPGLYVLEYAGVRTRSFRISDEVYRDVWTPSLDVFLAVQMDHMSVREAYRVWHGRPHRDDARQAPVNHEHFDLYAQGPSTDTLYAPGEHIPGLDVGGWFDAGDFDIRTQTQYAVVRSLVEAWEDFKPLRDQTSVDQARRQVTLHLPDGIPDIIQQIEQGALALLAQHRAVGHAIHGIVEPDLGQYTHLGDASTKTDNRVYEPTLKPGEEKGERSGTPDDRWAFTSKSSALNYGSCAGLAAASRALRGYRDELAQECLQTAQRVWAEEHSHAPDTFHHGNTTGGPLADEEFKAAVELLYCTGEERYAWRVRELLAGGELVFERNAQTILKALPRMGKAYREKVEYLVLEYKQRHASSPFGKNPYAVPISRGAWAGSGLVVHHALTQYALTKAFPEHFGRAEFFAAVDYLYGCHPGSDLSLVSGVGTASKEVAYGNNRADFSFIAGGVVPGVLIVKPDFPENKEDWPFFWGENEYVVDLAASHIYLGLAAEQLAARAGKEAR